MFEDRIEGGHLLAQKLLAYKKRKGVIVCGIPRGGVVTAKVLSDELHLPLDIVVTRKIGAPNQEELAIGAIAPEGSLILDSQLIGEIGIEESYIKKKTEEKSQEVADRLIKFRGKKAFKVKGKEVLLVDDGIATGATIEAAIKYLRSKNVKKIILASPVAPKDSIFKLRKLVDKLVVLKTPFDFHAVGQFYRYFPQVSDEEVIQLLHVQ